MNQTKCEYCGAGNEELRPYGKNGQKICFDCAMKPENKDETDRQFQGRLNAACDNSPSGIVMLGGEDGPQAYVPKNS